MEANDGRVQVEILVHCHGISNVLRQSKAFREKHEGAGQLRIELSVSLPKFTMIGVFGPIIGQGPMNVPKQAVEDVTGDDGTSKRRIR